jgi:TfoX/Sxy family transcriptional regulator of competence genes
MASSIETVHYISDQAGLGSRLTFKRMFGEFGLYVDGKVVAFVCDDRLYLKPTPEGRAFLGQVKLAPPYPVAKDHYLLDNEVDDPERLRGALEVTARVLPEPKPKGLHGKARAKKSKSNQAKRAKRSSK